MADLDDLFLDEEPAPSLAAPRKGRLQKGRAASPENKPPQRKKEKLGRKRPAAAARSESGSDSDAPIAAPSANPKKKKPRPPPPSVSATSGSESSADEEGAVARITARASPAQRAARRAARSSSAAAERGGGGCYSDGLSGSGSGSEEASGSDSDSEVADAPIASVANTVPFILNDDGFSCMPTPHMLEQKQRKAAAVPLGPRLEAIKAVVLSFLQETAAANNEEYSEMSF